jgi:hypothetical protein
MVRVVEVDGVEYQVDVLPSTPLHRERLASRSYVQVELPGRWRAVLTCPLGIRDTSQLWYRELIELVKEAIAVVAKRQPDISSLLQMATDRSE